MSKYYQDEAAAKRYDSARSMPQETMSLWADSLKKMLPDVSFSRVLDLGAGTGRFSEMLRDAFGCPVIAIDPSEAMLAEGRKRGLDNIVWQAGSAENIPLEDGSADLVWMSQVFHHLADPAAAFREIRRVLRPAGWFAVRNGIVENNEELTWIKFFPEAEKIESERPSRQDIIDSVCRAGFESTAARTVNQVFASSFAEYYEKISSRGLSSLLHISDEAFESGLVRMKEWIAGQPADRVIVEPVDLFVFRRLNQSS